MGKTCSIQELELVREVLILVHSSMYRLQILDGLFVYFAGNYLAFSSPAGRFWALVLSFSHRNFPIKPLITQQ